MGIFNFRSAIAHVGFIVFAIGLSSASTATAQKTKVLAPHHPVPSKLVKPVPLPAAEAGSIVGGPWMIDASLKSTIYIKNLVETSSVAATPILYLSNGVKYPLPSITLEPAGIATIDVNSALQKLGIAPYATLSGYMEIDYNWPWIPICATLRDLDTAHSLIFYYGFRPTKPTPLPNQPPPVVGPKTNLVEGMWWKHEPNVTGFVTLMNTGTQPVSAQVDVSDNLGAALAHHAIVISPHGTKLLALSELDSAAASQGGIRVTYTADANAILINGGLQDQSAGYSAIIPFGSSPVSASTSNSTIAELGIMTGPADPMLRFPAGLTFTPYTVLRNISKAPLSATPTLWWMSGGNAQSAQLSQISLGPYETQSLDVPAMLASAGLKSFSGSINVVFDIPGNAGGLLVAGGAVDQSNTYVFSVAPRNLSWSAGKSLSYWSTANGDDTMVTLWNPADEAQDFIFRLEYPGGHYRFPVHLAARATQMFNISEIVNSQVPDDEGNVIPSGVQEGSAAVMGTQDEVEHILVAMDSGIYNVAKATCGGYQCETCNGVTTFGVVDAPWETSVRGTNQLTFYETYNTGGQYSASGNWNSSATNIATVSNGLVGGVSAGSATMSVVDNYPEPGYTTGCGEMMPPCPIYTFNPGGSSGGNVTQITITGVVPPQVTLGTKGAFIISGSNFNQFTGQVTVTSDGPLVVTGAALQPNGTITANYDATNCSIPLGIENLSITGGIVDGGSGQSQNTWPISVVSPTAPSPNIMFGGNNITGTTQSVVVGQQIALSASIPNLPACTSLASQRWSTPPGNAVGGFTNNGVAGGPQPDTTGGHKAPLPSTTSSSYTFYWITSGNSLPMTYSYTLNTGVSSSQVTSTFNVAAPTGNLLLTAHMAQNASSGVQVLSKTNGPVLGTTGVALGGSQVGISFSSNATPVSGDNQSFTWVQIVTSHQTQYINSTGSFASPATPESGLDNTYPYANASATSTNDSPNAALPASYGEGWETFSATMYLMWDPALPSSCTPASTNPQNLQSTPSTCTSIPVPLSSVAWHWSGCAINTLSNQANGTTWMLSTASGCPVEILGTAQPSTFPDWSGRIVNQ